MWTFLFSNVYRFQSKQVEQDKPKWNSWNIDRVSSNSTEVEFLQGQEDRPLRCRFPGSWRGRGTFSSRSPWRCCRRCGRTSWGWCRAVQVPAVGPPSCASCPFPFDRRRIWSRCSRTTRSRSKVGQLDCTPPSKLRSGELGQTDTFQTREGSKTWVEVGEKTWSKVKDFSISPTPLAPPGFTILTELVTGSTVTTLRQWAAFSASFSGLTRTTTLIFSPGAADMVAIQRSWRISNWINP